MLNDIFILGANLPDSIPFTENHVHTSYTDGRNTIEEYVVSAMELGIRSIVFTEHVNRSSQWFHDYVVDVEKAKKKYRNQISIYCGIEAKALDYNGSIDATEDMVRVCDMVMGVVHRCPDPKGGMLEYTDLDGLQAVELEFRAAKSLLEKGNIDVLGHMGAMSELFYGPIPDHYYEELVKISRRTGRAIELNGKYHQRLDKLVRYCRRHNPLVSLGSDAHDISQIGVIYKRLKGMKYL